MDWVFAVNSAEMEENDFEIIKTFMLNFIENVLTGYEDSAHLAFLQFTNTISLQFNLHDQNIDWSNEIENTSIFFCRVERQRSR